MVQSQPEHETKPDIAPRQPLVRIIWFAPGEDTRQAEREITLHLSEGWHIAGVGGRHDAGFIVLQRPLA